MPPNKEKKGKGGRRAAPSAHPTDAALPAAVQSTQAVRRKVGGLAVRQAGATAARAPFPALHPPSAGRGRGRAHAGAAMLPVPGAPPPA